MQRNRLAAETSPYLLQHADNPVDWYPWGADALGRARLENKPILLSVGYSACHWCHVMAHESFEDPHIAALMNRWFVNIKVDREERPDLDRIYQIAQQLITQRNGGWPLTMFLSPEDQHPFFGGTYFPRTAGHGLPGFADLLGRVAQYYETHAAEIRGQNAELSLAFAGLAPAVPAGRVLLDAAPLEAARRALEKVFDAQHGGFGHAPKFPQTGSIARCLRQWHATSHSSTPDLHALFMATLTLTRMAEGGIYDQLGGGFARYSVDDAWVIPHFEKMLYDNAQLLDIYASAYAATGEPLFRRIAGETADWMVREMRGPTGGFYSSLDADSEGHEGRFYVWQRDEVRALLDSAQYAAFSRRFGLDRDANFENAWHLHAAAPAQSGTEADLDAARHKLLEARNGRVWPARDEKILTSWNALAIKGLAAAGRALARPDLTEAASAAVDAIRRDLWQGGRLLATAKDGRAHLPAYLDDYAFLADALLDLLQNRWRTTDLQFAVELIDVMLTRFADPEHGGFFFTASDHEKLIHRTKSFSDDSLPAGNGVAISVLCRIGYLLGELRYVEAAERALVAAWPTLLDTPRASMSLAHMSLLNALEEFLTSTQILIIRGTADESGRWARQLGALYAPMRMIFAIPTDSADLPPALDAKTAGAATTGYLCTGMTCGAPLTDLGELARKLTAGVGA